MSYGKNIIAQNMAERAYKKSVQERMDEEMCRPGYRWHGEPLNKCLPGAVIGSSIPGPGIPEPQPTPEPAPETPTADEAISAEMAKRKQSKG